MGTEERKKRIFYISTPWHKNDRILKSWIEDEKRDLKILKNMKWTTDDDRSVYPYGMGKEWEK